MCFTLDVLCEFANSLDKRTKSSIVCKDQVHCSLTCTILCIRMTTSNKRVAILITVGTIQYSLILISWQCSAKPIKTYLCLYAPFILGVTKNSQVYIGDITLSSSWHRKQLVVPFITSRRSLLKSEIHWLLYTYSFVLFRFVLFCFRYHWTCSIGVEL